MINEMHFHPTRGSKYAHAVMTLIHKRVYIVSSISRIATYWDNSTAQAFIRALTRTISDDAIFENQEQPHATTVFR